MDAQLIEKLDKTRYRTMLWQMIGFAVFFPTIIIGYEISSVTKELPLPVLLCFLTGFGIGLFTVALIKSSRVKSRIKSDPGLNEALNNEMHRLYEYKSLACGFYSMIVAAVLLGIAGTQFHISLMTICWFIIYVGILALQIARLVYNRK